MKVAVLALQGAFAEHEQMLESIGIEYMEIRQKKDANQSFDALILPGGESTVMGKLLRDLGLLPILKKKIEDGLPVLGTCAGLILLADNLSGGEMPHLATMPITVKRNAYGRQLCSFRTEAELKGVGSVPMVFIRAPYIEKIGEEVEILAKVDGHIVAVRYKNQIGVSFHPELADCSSIYQMLLQSVTL
ncbi:MAG: pyridoxal 5'-phosphate synthase glutaminase subunit PdxT [Lachnospiraceae bacterium]|jgi:5'-phosphate synthase pdxT subunit|nr:pyridoxal 5'-phosphate synthase glutaminase subunit PdxT [Lachnospiraceae bacterium]